MKTLLSLTLLILMSSTLVSCSGGKASAKLEISRAFAVNGGQFDGGLMVHGVSSAGKNVTLSIQGSYTKSFTLDADTWTFYAVGWNGPNKFEGAAYCGKSSPQNIANNSTVSINVSTTNCNTLESEIGYQYTKFLTCSAFYKYTSTSDSWSLLASGDADSNCKTNFPSAPYGMPLGYGPKHNAYKLIAYDVVDGVKSQVFESECYQADGAQQSFFPNKLFPVEVVTYSDTGTCIAGATDNAKFFFSKGLENGGDDFKHHKNTWGSSPVQSRLLIPTAFTRTGFSPFMDILPGIKCGSTSTSQTDCGTDIAEAVHFYVPYNSESERQIMSRKTNRTSCNPSTVLFSKFFNVTECSIENENLVAKLTTNNLTCQAAPILNIVDLYRADQYIFMLIQDPVGNDLFKIYDTKGKFITSLAHSIIEGAVKIAAYHNSGNFTVGLLKSSGSVEMAWANTGGGSGFNASVSVPTNSLDIEMANDRLIYSTNDGYIGVKQFNDNLISHSQAVAANTNPISSITLFYGYRLFYLQENNARSKGWDGNDIGADLGTISLPASAVTLAYASDLTPMLYVLSSNGNVAAYNAVDAAVYTSNNTGQASPYAMVANANIVYSASSAGLNVYRDNMWIQISETDGDCSENPIIDGNGLVIRTRTGPFQYSAHNDAMKFWGRSYLTNPNFAAQAFPTLGDDEGVEPGGLINKVSKMLSPHALGGVVASHATNNLCSDLLGQTIISSKTLFDSYENRSFTINYTISPSAATVPLFACVNGSYDGTGCSPFSYDLDFNFYITEGSGEYEKGKLQLKCGSKLGTFETLEVEGVEKDRRLFVWNTNDFSKARLEFFDYRYEGPANFEASVTKIEKDGTDIFTRKIEASERSGGISTSDLELHRVGSRILSKKTYQSPIAWGFSSGPYGDNNYNGDTAPECIDTTTTSVYTSVQTCSFGSRVFTGTVSKANDNSVMPLRMDSLNDLDLATPQILKYFTIDP